MSMKTTIFLVLLSPLVLTRVVLAETIYLPGRCDITTQFNLPSLKGEKIPASLNIHFDRKTALPRMRLELPEQINSKEVSLNFPSLEVLRQNGEKIFNDSYHDELIQFSQKEFKFYKIGDGNYLSPSLGIRGSQFFVTLILSQYGFYVVDPNSKQKAYASLRGSDISVRSMLKNCFPELSAPYLEGLRRKSGVGQSWQVTYGLYDFSGRLDEASSVLNHVPEVSDSIEDTHLITEKLWYQLQQRKLLVDQLAQLQSTDEFTEKVNDFETHANSLWTSLKKVNHSYGENGQSQYLLNLIEDLQAKIKGLEKRTAQVDQQLQPVVQEYLLETQKLTQYLTDLESYNSRMAAVDNEISQTKANIDYLSETLKANLRRLEQELRQFDISPATTVAPYSMEEIKAMNNDAMAILRKKRTLDRRISFLKRILDEMTTINEAQNQVLSTFADMSEKSHSLSKIKAQHDTLTQELQDLKSLWDGLDRRSLEQKLSLFWQHNSNVLQSDELKQILLSEIKNSYSEYDRMVQSLRGSLLPVVLCQSDSFKKGFQRACLTPQEVYLEPKYIQYFNDLDTSDFEALVQSNLRIQGPFDPQTNINSLVLQLYRDLNQPQMPHIMEMWEDMVFYRWMYFSARELEKKHEAISAEIFQNYLSNQNQQLLLAQKTLDDLTAEFVVLSLEQSTTLDRYRQQEQRYFADFQRVHMRVLSIVSLNDLEPDTKGLSCLLANAQFVSCYPQIKEELGVDQNERTDSLLHMADLTILLRKTSVVKLQELLQVKEGLLQEREPLSRKLMETWRSYDTLSRSEYLEDLRLRKSELEEALTQTQNNLANTQTELESTRNSHKMLVSEAQFHAGQIEVLYNELAPLKPLIAEHCQREESVVTQMARLDQKIANLVGASTLNATDSLSKYCQIW